MFVLNVTLLSYLFENYFLSSFRLRLCIQYHLLLLLSHVVIVVKLCCVEGLMEDICISSKHSR